MADPIDTPALPTAPAEAAADPHAAEIRKAKDTARLAWALGITSMTLTMVGPCFYYMPMMIALPLAMVAMHQARTALAAPHIDEGGRVYGQTGMVSAGIALGWSALVLLIVITVLVLYFGFLFGYMALIFALIGAGGFPPPPPPSP